MTADSLQRITDEERAKALDMTFDEFVNYREGVLNAYKVGNPVAVETKRPVVVSFDQQTGKILKVKAT